MISTSIMDHWPHLCINETRVVTGTCLFCFIAALPKTCNGGFYLFTLMEWHTASWAVFLIGFAEIDVISWIYGIERMFKNLYGIDIQLKKAVKYYWKFVLIIVTPITCNQFLFLH
jgi:SNF family Na+-dependent transporter